MKFGIVIYFMPKRFHLNRPDCAAAVAVALPTCKNVKDQQRVLAMRLAASGELTAAQIAHHVGISRRQFFNWVTTLKQGGVPALLERKHGGGAAPQITGKVLEALRAGLQAGQWKRAKEIQQWLRQEHRVELSLKGVYYWLGKLGGVLKVPRKAHAKKGRGPNGRVSAAARRQARGLERAWWQTGADLGGR